ncbi:Cytoplasmic dynein 1 light intermediate chain 1 [Goodea atripinnis]|uniref:Dynein light intermediate chain n=1 Tax=Goodea atripinnis TaxID=208336 RepID=A0ABV0NGZ3_9TELE
MATTGRSALLSSTSSGPKSTLESSNPEEEDGQNLWSTILSEVSTHSRSKLPSGKNVLVMGGYLSAVSWLANGHREVGSGKTTLVAKLQGIEEYMKGRGLEYLYFSVHDDDIDDYTRCNAWVLDGDLYHKGLQGVAVPVGSIEDTLLLITVDMSRPWNALDSLQKWAAVAREHIDKLRVAPEKLRELEHKSRVHIMWLAFWDIVVKGSTLLCVVLQGFGLSNWDGRIVCGGFVTLSVLCQSVRLG